MTQHKPKQPPDYVSMSIASIMYFWLPLLLTILVVMVAVGARCALGQEPEPPKLNFSIVEIRGTFLRGAGGGPDTLRGSFVLNEKSKAYMDEQFGKPKVFIVTFPELKYSDEFKKLHEKQLAISGIVAIGPLDKDGKVTVPIVIAANHKVLPDLPKVVVEQPVR